MAGSAFVEAHDETYQVTRGCVIAALEEFVPTKGREIIPAPDSDAAYTTKSFAGITKGTDPQMQYIINLSEGDHGDLYVGEIHHNYRENLSDIGDGIDIFFQFTTSAAITYNGTHYNDPTYGEGNYQPEIGLEAIDNRLRGCLAIG